MTQNQPSSEPLSLSEAKKHLEIANAECGHDEQIESLIKAAREVWEHDTQSITTTRNIVEKLNEWPSDGWRFYHRPIVSITSIAHFDTSNVSQVVASSVYSLDVGNRALYLAPDQTWPSIYSRWDAITITYVAGETTVSEIAKSAMKLQLDILFELRGVTKEKDACFRAYDGLVQRFMRSTYP